MNSEESITYDDLREMDQQLKNAIVRKHISNEELALWIDKEACLKRLEEKKEHRRQKQNNGYFAQTGKYKKGR